MLHERFLAGLGDLVVTDEKTEGALTRKPLEITTRPPLPHRLRLYLFNCTDHPSERRAGDYRIQLRLPAQQRRHRGELHLDADSLVILAGYVAEFDVFVLWDAHAHAEFPYSKGVQVGAPTVYQAAIRGSCEQRRTVRANAYPERVVAVRSDHLIEGIQQRERLTRESLLDRDDRDQR